MPIHSKLKSAFLLIPLSFAFLICPSAHASWGELTPEIEAVFQEFDQMLFQGAVPGKSRVVVSECEKSKFEGRAPTELVIESQPETKEFPNSVWSYRYRTISFVPLAFHTKINLYGLNEAEREDTRHDGRAAVAFRFYSKWKDTRETFEILLDKETGLPIDIRFSEVMIKSITSFIRWPGKIFDWNKYYCIGATATRE